VVEGQSAIERRNIFTQAESHYLFEEYDLANQLYILLDSPENCNIKYKIGTCYLHIPGEKEKAIPYLEAAIRDVSYDAQPTQFKEMRAPLEAYFNLAKAYMINNELEKALSTLKKFSQLAKATQQKGGMENLDYINQQILSCKNAITFRQNPVNMTKEILGHEFSQGSINDNPAVSFDGNSIVYSERRGTVNVLFYSVKEKRKMEDTC
jgi:tetratricopeptide (TPR) repeat protein